MARGGSFDERITVVNLVLDALGAEFAAYAREDAAVVRLHELLGRYKNGNQSLTEFITANRKSLEIKRQNALLSTEEARREEWVLHRLGEMELAVKQAHIRDEKEQLVLLRTLFGQDVQRREDLIRRHPDGAFPRVPFRGGLLWRWAGDDPACIRSDQNAQCADVHRSARL